ncbi:RING/U-box superfamily protein [Striga hermonthica]|uniref:RING/U-box superfamily protein n=1 Tax=Striga hermonthica TaxID=68872 RepID=A0A9N7QZQ9_STRHE|nr:RING/U-box superfamily protein [Striga hermonthica]
MVVCKCRKATKLYCFVHNVPVCGECVCFPEHQICVVRTYSEWVIDGEYDWPPKCCSCQAVLDEGSNPQTTRLGCLHVIHTSCLVSHIKSFPPHTAPAGYVCPGCSTSIWPPKSVKDSGSRLHSYLKEAILQTGLEKNLFGNHPVSLGTETRSPPPAFASEPLMHPSAGKDAVPTATGFARPASWAYRSLPRDFGEHPRGPCEPYVDHQGVSQLEVHSDSIRSTKFTHEVRLHRGVLSRLGRTIRHKFLRSLLPFWSSALPTLPVTAPPRKDASHTDDSSEGRTRHHKSSRMDPRKLLLVIAIMACMATMGILYYRIAQRDLGEDLLYDEVQ